MAQAVTCHPKMLRPATTFGGVGHGWRGTPRAQGFASLRQPHPGAAAREAQRFAASSLSKRGSGQSQTTATTTYSAQETSGWAKAMMIAAE